MPSKSLITVDVLLQPPPALKGRDCKENGTKMLLQLNLLWDSSVMASVARILVPFVSVVAGVAQKAYERGVPKNVYTIKTISQQKLYVSPFVFVRLCVVCVRVCTVVAVIPVQSLCLHGLLPCVTQFSGCCYSLDFSKGPYVEKIFYAFSICFIMFVL